MDITCPYCYETFELHDSGEYFRNDDDRAELECENPDCEKKFMGRFSISYSIYEEKADCLNGAPHKWRDRIVAPKFYGVGKQYCEDCDEERDLPDFVVTLSNKEALDAIMKMAHDTPDGKEYKLVEVVRDERVDDYLSENSDWYIFKRNDGRLYRLSYSKAKMKYQNDDRLVGFMYEGSSMLRVIKNENGVYSYAPNDIDEV